MVKETTTMKTVEEQAEDQAQAERQYNAHLLKDLRRGDLVRAIGHVDPDGANVAKGTYGVVFEESEYHEPKSGPMVRWVTGSACNVYGDWVEKVDLQNTMPLRLFEKERYKARYMATITGSRWAITVLGRHEEETLYQKTLEEAYSFVRAILTEQGFPLERVQEHFKDESNRYFYIHLANDKKEGDGFDRHILFQRLR